MGQRVLALTLTVAVLAITAPGSADEAAPAIPVCDVDMSPIGEGGWQFLFFNLLTVEVSAWGTCPAGPVVLDGCLVALIGLKDCATKFEVGDSAGIAMAIRPCIPDSYLAVAAIGGSNAAPDSIRRGPVGKCNSPTISP